MGDNFSHSMGDNSSHDTGGNSTTNLFSDRVKVPRLQTKDSGTDRLNGNQILESELDNTLRMKPLLLFFCYGHLSSHYHI
jgi:hypothetical protein